MNLKNLTSKQIGKILISISVLIIIIQALAVSVGALFVLASFNDIGFNFFIMATWLFFALIKLTLPIAGLYVGFKYLRGKTIFKQNKKIGNILLVAGAIFFAYSLFIVLNPEAALVQGIVGLLWGSYFGALGMGLTNINQNGNEPTEK